MDVLLEITGIGPILAKKLLKLINPKKNIYDELEKLRDMLPAAALAYLHYRPVKKVPREYFEELSKKVLIAGSFRREQPFINDLDILTQNYSEIAHLFEKPYAQGEEIIRTYFAFFAPGKKDAFPSPTQSVGEKDYIAVDIFIYKDLAPYLLYATGSKQFNVIMRGIAKKKGYVLNQHGLFKNNQCIKTETEEDIFKILGMTYLPPSSRNICSLILFKQYFL
jgi:DNA polymerase/3'-5' exonuclease PolX